MRTSRTGAPSAATRHLLEQRLDAIEMRLPRQRLGQPAGGGAERGAIRTQRPLDGRGGASNLGISTTALARPVEQLRRRPGGSSHRNPAAPGLERHVAERLWRDGMRGTSAAAGTHSTSRRGPVIKPRQRAPAPVGGRQSLVVATRKARDRRRERFRREDVSPR
jgi:hypothetical protein